MDEQQIKKAIYDGYHAAILVAIPVSIDDFFAMNVDYSIPGGYGTSQTEDQEYRNVSAHVQNKFLVHNAFITGLTGDIIKSRKSKSWNDVYDFCAMNVTHFNPLARINPQATVYGGKTTSKKKGKNK
jgi:hypothetical protein